MPPPDGRHPFPDKAHEDLATWVEETLADQADAFDLIDTTFVLLDDAVESIDTGSSERGQLQQRITDLEATVADLTSRLEALETPTPPEEILP